MKTTVYVIRHSKPLGMYESNESLQLRNAKNILSVEGEEKASNLCNLEELKNVDTIYSSHYVRAIATAKYIANMLDLPINIDERFGERKFGIDSWDEMPENFNQKQIQDFDYKTPNGESINDTKKRMLDGLNNVLEQNKGKTIVIVSHSTAMCSMFTKWCEADFSNGAFTFNGQLVFDGKWSAPEVFKLEFDENNNLVNMNSIKNME